MRVLEQRRRSDCQRAVDNLGDGQQILTHSIRKFRSQKAVQNLLVGNVGQRHGIEVVERHELVEYVGAEHHGAWYGYRDTVEIVAFGILLDNRIYKRQAAPLSSERALTYAGKVAVGVETVLAELRHHAAVFHLAILHDQIEEKLFYLKSLRNVAKAVPGDDIGDGEHRTRIEPAGYVVAAGVIVQSFVGNLKQSLLHFVERMYAHYFRPVMWVAHHEVAETEIMGDLFAEIHRELLGCLVKKNTIELFDILGVGHFGRLHDNRQIGIARTHKARESQTCLLVLDTLAHK